ncbi:OadG family transporter subunit [uncultured Bacteroides sp.]|uniref:OadG family transporter subunit n=1 Tax=uncultured Bacteroides sp. TaxID=162156 RepID=UPI002AA8A5A1|nr:OadG family transporter subunit [uncultured Bacteroides sp.]
MNKRKTGILIVLLAAVSLSSYGQGAKSLKINEVLVKNTENFQDNYGQRHAWIEIFNTSFASVDIKSCYLTNDKRVLDPNLSVEEKEKIMYSIPKSDILTDIPPRQHLLFWADGMANRGTFHLNFKLDTIASNWIALYDANGRTLIDSITVPANIPANFSYAREADGKSKWVIKGGSDESYVTPETNNLTQDKQEKVVGFRKHDAIGIGMSVMAMSIVFFGLILLYLSFRIVGAISVKLAKRNAMRAHGITDLKEAKEKAMGTESGEVFAAIALALHEYQDNVHDIEDTILTINRVKRNYSPWSSKIYTLRQTPRK